MGLLNLKKLTKNDIDDIDLIFVQDMNESETKTLLSLDLFNNIISSTNLDVRLKTGSFDGQFVGNHIGSSTNCTSSILSLYSHDSNFLNYPNISTSSYSLQTDVSFNSITSSNSLSSSYSSQSYYSDTSSYVNTLIYATSSNSLTSSISKVSKYSDSSDFLIYDDLINTEVYKSIISDYSLTSSLGYEIISNATIPIKTTSDYENDPALIKSFEINDSKAYRSVSSSLSDHSQTSDYIDFVPHSKFSSYAANNDNTVFAYVNFDVILSDAVFDLEGGKIVAPIYTFVINQYKNIAEPGIGLGYNGSNIITFTGSYFSPPSDPDSRNKVPAVVGEICLSRFPVYSPTSYFFRSYAFPIGKDKFGISLRVGRVTEDGDSSGAQRGMMDGANVSIIVCANTIGKSIPEMIPSVETFDEASLMEACTKLR